MFSCILQPYSRLDLKYSYPIPDLLVSMNFNSVAVGCLCGKSHPILDQNSLIYTPYPRLNYSKSYPSQQHIPIYLICGSMPSGVLCTGRSTVKQVLNDSNVECKFLKLPERQHICWLFLFSLPVLLRRKDPARQFILQVRKQSTSPAPLPHPSHGHPPKVGWGMWEQCIIFYNPCFTLGIMRHYVVIHTKILSYLL